MDDPPALARRLSDRHFGVGGDRLVLIAPSDKADFRMVMYNADGSRGRCAATPAGASGNMSDFRGMTDKTVVTLEADSGVKTLNLTVENEADTNVCVDMERADSGLQAVPCLLGRASSSRRRSRLWGAGLKSRRFRWATPHG